MEFTPRWAWQGVGTRCPLMSLPSHMIPWFHNPKCILTVFYPTAFDYSIQFWEAFFFFIIVISYLTHTLIYETFLISKVLAKHSLISHRAGKKTLQWCWEAHILGTCGECLWLYAHLRACPGLTGTVVICAGHFQWWNCTQTTWDKLFLQERAASSSSTAPHTEFGVRWHQDKKERRNIYSCITFFKNKTIHFQEYWEHPLLFFFLIVSESSIKVNFHTQEKNMS